MVGGEQALSQGLVGGHVGHLHHQHEVRARGDSPALLHLGIGHHMGLKSVQRLLRLHVQAHLDQRAHAPAQCLGHAVRREDGHLFFDHPLVAQALEPAVTGGRREVGQISQGLVGQAGVVLQQREQTQVGGIELKGGGGAHG